MRGLSPSASSHSMTSTARAPRDSMTRTVAPLGSGFSDQARKASEPPRILMSTSPGPASPRVATMRTPTEPTQISSLTTVTGPLHRKCQSQRSPRAGVELIRQVKLTVVSLQRMTRPAATAEAAPRTGVAMAVIMSGVLMTAVDTTIVVLALPEIQRGLHVSLSAVIWVIISFLLVITLLATQVGRLGDMFGRVRMYETGFGIFVLGSLACALAWNEASIIAFRVVQGIGGAFIMANSGAVIADLYPRELRGRAYGFT